MKYLTLLVVFLFSMSIRATADTSNDEYRLVWADEFDLDGKPDPKNWAYENGFVRNNELQWYQRDNAVCKDGEESNKNLGKDLVLLLSDELKLLDR